MMVTGCSSKWEPPVLAIPVQVTYDDELRLAQISQELARRDLDNSYRAQLFFQRATVYDALGFNAFAQSDLAQVLSYDASITGVYNYLGIYAMQEHDFNSAFLAFNTALEIEPDYIFANFNRAIALYRSERYEFALDDALAFYNNSPEEPIRMLWLYLIERELNPQQAALHLHDHYNALPDKQVWGSDIVAYYLGQVSEAELMQRVLVDASTGELVDNYTLAGRLCEMYFYLGKDYLSRGDVEKAKVYFKYALANNIYNYVEHRQALYELEVLDGTAKQYLADE